MFDKSIAVCNTAAMTTKEPIGIRLAMRVSTTTAVAVDIAAQAKKLSRSDWLRRAVANQLEADRDKSPRELAALKKKAEEWAKKEEQS